MIYKILNLLCLFIPTCALFLYANYLRKQAKEKSV